MSMTVTDEFSTRLDSLASHWRVSYQFLDRLYGAVPAHPDLIRGWIKARMGLEGRELDEMVAKTLSEIAIDEEELTVHDLGDEEIDEIVQEQERQTTQVFKTAEDGALCVEARTLKAAMRQQQKRLNLSAAGRAADLKNAIWITPIRIPLMRDGEPIREPDGYERFAKSLPYGSALARHAYVEQATITFDLHILRTAKLEVEDVKDIIAACQQCGYGAMHNLGEGRFMVTQFEEIEVEDE